MESKYTDFSCRTPIERLARDIETTLRSWHLFSNDRHVSSPSDDEQDGSRSKDETNDRHGDDVESFLSPTRRKMSSIRVRKSVRKEKEVRQGVRLIRSKDLVYNGRPLTLSLWDGPPDLNDASKSSCFSEGNKSDVPIMSLPLSLERVNYRLGKNINHDFTLNLSTLFGIGQHITLDYGRRASHSDIMLTLQSALNLATDACKCRIPAFAISCYPDSSTWLLDSACYHSIPNSSGFNFSGYCTSGLSKHSPYTYLSTEFFAGNIPKHFQSVEGVASLFLKQIKHRFSAVVDINDFILSFARHRFLWLQKRVPKPSHDFRSSIIPGLKVDWRRDQEEAIIRSAVGWSVEGRKAKCILHAVKLVEGSNSYQSSTRWKKEVKIPTWGAFSDPLKSASVTVQWNEDETASFLKTTSFVDETTFFNPVFIQNEFLLKVEWNESVPCNTLGLSLRCALAAYVKATTVHSGLLLSNLTSKRVRDDLVLKDGAVHNSIIEPLDDTTKSLLEAMDWDDTLPNPVDINDIVEEIFSDFTPFPSKESKSSNHPKVQDGQFSSLLNFQHSAPVGRLFSVMAMRLTKMKTPVAMASLWIAFTEFMRVKYDIYESLPNLDRVEEIDGVVVHKYNDRVRNTYIDEDRISNVNSFEADPDLSHCLIYQKMQAFNVCIESITQNLKASTKAGYNVGSKLETVVESEQLDHKESSSIASTHDFEESPDREASVVSFVDEDDSLRGNDIDSREENGRFQQLKKTETEFFDINEELPPGDVIAGDGFGPLTKKETTFFDSVIEEGLTPLAKKETSFFDTEEYGDNDTKSQNVVKSVFQSGRRRRINRKGARCALKGMVLKMTNDHMYAPFLKRTAPQTIDVIFERKAMFATFSNSDRIELVHRLQRPKLLSDMQSFKAANPNKCVFEDFISWYGNPVDTLDEELLCSTSATKTTFAALDAASEAVQFLTATRRLWMECWEVATPTPAENQKPLFDPNQEIEKILHYFETMHPTHLINQVISVNFTNAFFLLHSTSGKALEIPCVRRSFERLEELVWKAVRLLNGTLLKHSEMKRGDGESKETISPQVVAICEDVCDCVSALEMLLSYATSLLHAFPGALDIIEHILMSKDNKVLVKNVESRKIIFRAISKQQISKPSGQEIVQKIAQRPKDNDMFSCSLPSTKEYVFRTVPGKAPCRLYAQIGESDDCFGHTLIGKGVTLALTKSSI